MKSDDHADNTGISGGRTIFQWEISYISFDNIPSNAIYL